MKYKHALFIFPYVESLTSSLMGIFPATGLEYVAASAKGYVDKITLLDLRHEKELSSADKLLEFIRNEGVDIICVGVGWDRQFEDVCSLLNRMPEDIPLVVGGNKATEKVEELFKICKTIDIIVRGEGEETIRDILKGVPVENILGISYKKNGRIINNGNRALTDVTAVPAPDRSLRRNKYRIKTHGINVTGVTWDTVLSTRGCPFNCKFCTFNLNPLGQKRTYAERSVESVVDEIGEITADAILFSDDNFATNVKRAEAMCDLIIARGIKKRFLAQARIEIAKSPALLEKMVKAGFKFLSLGIESPHDRILEQLNKGFDSATIRRLLKVFRKYPMVYHGFFIFGNIGETEEEMMYIVKFAKEIGLDTIGYSKLRVDKYSPLRQIAENTPGFHVTDRGEAYSDAYDHPALKKIGKRIRFSFYTPLRILKIGWKFMATGFFTFWEAISLLAVLPILSVKIILRDIQKGRLKESIRRVFVSNK